MLGMNFHYYPAGNTFPVEIQKWFKLLVGNQTSVRQSSPSLALHSVSLHLIIQFFLELQSRLALTRRPFFFFNLKTEISNEAKTKRETKESA